MNKKKNNESQKKNLPKALTGIDGFDEISNGGLPKNRITLICGGPGCGKTLFGMEFLANGIKKYNEPGVLVAFEENSEEIKINTESIGFGLTSLVKEKKLFIDNVYIERSEIEETGEYDLSGLFARIENAINAVKAKRIVLDTLEALFTGFSNEALLRAEIRRLFRWLKEKNVTTVVTGEKGADTISRYGLEEYVSDCVIFLDHRTNNQISTRRIRIIKYRGSSHETNEYPFIISNEGIVVVPISSLRLAHKVSSDRISTGIGHLDSMLGGKGYFKGSSILITGPAGSGKTSILSHYASAACKRGEKILFLSFEESFHQIIRNMNSIGIHLESFVKKGLLTIIANRPSLCSLETHMTLIFEYVKKYNPQSIIIDPINSLIEMGSANEVRAMLVRIIDVLKTMGITSVYTNLTSGDDSLEKTEANISSLSDTWILLKNIEYGGERNRGLFVLKSRGMAHSNQIREFVISDKGIELTNVYIGQKDVLTGTSRIIQENIEREEIINNQNECEARKHNIEWKRVTIEAGIAALQAELKFEEFEFNKSIELNKYRNRRIKEYQKKMGEMRKDDTGQ